MAINFYNETMRTYGTVREIQMNLGVIAYSAVYVNEYRFTFSRIHPTIKDAERDMNKHGYFRIGFVDETGCARYTMTREQLQALYKQFENFVADCTQQEYNENKESINAVYALIHKHINAETTN